MMDALFVPFVARRTAPFAVELLGLGAVPVAVGKLVLPKAAPSIVTVGDPELFWISNDREALSLNVPPDTLTDPN